MGSEGAGHEIEVRENGPPSQDRLFTIHDMISEINRESKEKGATPSRNVEEDIFVEDIELVNIETSPSSLDVNVSLSSSAMVHTVGPGNGLNLENSMTENQQNNIQCLNGTGLIMQTLNKYLKNALISLLILISLPFLHLPTLYAFLTNSECENFTLMAITEFTYYVWFCLYTFLPVLIKLKLDRLSE